MNRSDEMTPDGPCGRVREDVYDYIEESGELSETRRRAIRRHVDACPPCAAHFRSAAALQAALPLWEAPRPAPDFAERVVRAARHERDAVGAPDAGRVVRRRSALPFAWAAAAAVLVTAGLTIVRLFAPGGGDGLSPRSGGEPVHFSYSADVAAPAALTFVSGPDPSVVSRVLRPVASQR